MLTPTAHLSEPVPIGRRDIAIALAFVALGLVLMVDNVQSGESDVSWLAVPVFLAVTVPILWRRRDPLGVAIATLVGLLVHAALFGTLIRCGLILPLSFVLAFTAGSRLELRPALLGLGLAVALLGVMSLSDTEVEPSFLPVLGAVAAALWGVGRVVRSRSQLVTQLEARTGELRAARDDRARIEVATDRARLSGELDALLHQRLHELTLLAEAGASGDGTAPAATLAQIERDSRRTLEEMRVVVGSLRSEDGAAPVAPQPTLTHLEALLVRAKGDDARLRVDGSPRALPAGVELSAYRVVEHLLDAVEDAPGVDVQVRFDDAALELVVAGPAGRRRSAALAVERARERVALHHGSLRATTRSGRTEAVVQLPVAVGV